ncbi:helix-turn-helix domain-containing protein [Candidatus Halobonum tyrrellensis]|uniref:DNA binding domain-containing protein n=1 Tax=Candidatus Halobonum tyrrellensis G22 TaxID=1324957 RepID=V4J4B2_9EURY|nr:helix-turn-helix domain-containing protein [Candidatus Halobonum tyrrellensis]ESP90207.1 DNA binding domain-containing protein [Candidatus Halobonum tyrrellensis G22]
MATLVNGSVPAEQFALAETFAAHPDLSFRVDKFVASGEDAVMPLLWAQHVPAEELEATLEADPTVRDAALLNEQDGEALYEMTWSDNIQLVLQMITNSRATVLDAIGENGRWKFHVLYPAREEFSKTSEFCDSHGVDFDVHSIREVDRSSASRYGLTSEQRDSIVDATRRGYFEVPRQVTLQELSEAVGVSHQALSERLRRAIEALVENTLLYEDVDTGEAELAVADD